jgi:small-conductance mechanosensitive channel
MDSFILEIIGENPLLKLALVILMAVLNGLALRWLVFSFLKLYQKRKPFRLKEQVRTQLKTPLKFLLPLLFVYASFSILKINTFWYTVTEIFIIVDFAWVLIAYLKTTEEVEKEKFKIKAHHKAKDRKVLTVLQFIKSIATVVIITLAISAILWNIPAAQQLGKTILTSVGVLGIIVGVAAQKSIANLVTGFQLAFTQPIKTDDEVVIEGELGSVEDVTLTNVVVKTWDWCRLVLPLSYFNDKPFVNCTFNSNRVIASVFFYVDFIFPATELRIKLMEVLKDAPLWDNNIIELLATDSDDGFIKLRATFSVKNASDAWNLRGKVREELMYFIQHTYPDKLPKIRRVDTKKVA